MGIISSKARCMSMKRKSAKAILLAAYIFFTNGLSAQDSTAAQKMLAAQNFVFDAQTAISQNGANRQLTDGYTLSVTKDKIVAYLPYFGIAYSAPLDREKAGIEFSSTEFTYTAAAGKKGRTEIKIVPLNITADVRDITLTVFPNGSASLHVNSNLRQSMDFEGEINPPVVPKKKKS